MKTSTKQIVEGSPAIKADTIAYSDNFILTGAGVLNIFSDLTDSDCQSIRATNRLSQIQFAKSFDVSDRTFGLINDKLLSSDRNPTLRFTLNGYGAVKDLSCLKQLSNAKSLAVDMFKNNQLDKINLYTRLTKLTIGGNISIKSIVEQDDLEELFLFEKLKEFEVINALTKLKKIAFSKITLKNLDFLVGLSNLKELHFMLGSATNYNRLPDIGKIENLSFTLVRQLTTDHLLPINRMKYLKVLKFDTQAHLTNLDWLTNKSIKTDVINCKTFKA